MEYRINDDELIYMIRENDDIAVNTIFSKYKPIIMKVCSSYYDFAKTHGVEFCDLVQEGNISLSSKTTDNSFAKSAASQYVTSP